MLGLAVEHQNIAEGLKRERRRLQQMAQLSEAACWVAVHVEQCAVVQRDLQWQQNYFCHRDCLACIDSDSKHISIINCFVNLCFVVLLSGQQNFLCLYRCLRQHGSHELVPMSASIMLETLLAMATMQWCNPYRS